MLSELWLLSNALDEAGLAIEAKNPRVHLPGRAGGPCYRVRLGESGVVSAVEKLSEEEWPGLWTVREGNQNSFPVARFSLDIESSKEWSKTTALLARLAAEKAAELIEVSGSNQLMGVRAMAERFRIASANPVDLRQQLLRVEPSLADLAARSQLAFDIDLGTIYRSGTRKAVEAALPAGRGPGRSKIHTGYCGFTGLGGALHAESFPKVRLPVLNKDFPIYSMFGEAACNFRYGLADSAAVSVSTEAVLRMQDALVHILEERRNGRTWRGVASGRYERGRERQDLLIAYVDGEPDLPAPVASMIGSDPAIVRQQFEVDSKAVCDSLDGIAARRPLSRLNLFVLRGVSDGQVRVQTAAQPTVSQVLTGARRWQDAAANLPAFRLVLPAGEGRMRLVGPRVPTPDQVVRVTSQQWHGSPPGSRAREWTPAPGCDLADVLKVLLQEEGAAATAVQLLDTTLSRGWPLLVGLGGARTWPWATLAYSVPARRYALSTASVISTLLWALNRRQEEYMETAPFLMGQWLQLVDLLHREYSIIERKRGDREDSSASGDQDRQRRPPIPPQLLGNAMMVVARDDLNLAMERLGERLLIYMAWATHEPRAGLARWAVRRMGEVTARLSATPIPALMDTITRAELLLGYLSRTSQSIPASEDDNGSGQDDDDDTDTDDGSQGGDR